MDKKNSAQTKEELVGVLGRRYSKSIKMVQLPKSWLSAALADPANGFRLRLSFTTSRAYAQRVKAAKADFRCARAARRDGENKWPYVSMTWKST